MRAVLFLKSFFLLFVLSLAAFVFTSMDLLTLAKLIAASILLSIIFVFVYPEIRGVKNGDIVMVISSDSPYSITTRFGKALSNARKNAEVKIRLSDGTEIVGILQSYEGFLTPPKVQVMYEEQLVEKWKY